MSNSITETDEFKEVVGLMKEAYKALDIIDLLGSIRYGSELVMTNKPTKYFEQLKVEDLHKALNRILSQQFLQVKIERYERNFIWHRLMNELAKVSSVVER